MTEYVRQRRQLRNLLIHKPIQREYTLLMIGMMMAAILMVTMIIHYTMRGAVLGSPYRVGRVSPYEILSEVNELLILRVGLALLILVLAATAIGIVFLHRVAGPIYRFRLLLRRLALGDIPNDVKLRDRDYLKEVAADFNGVFKSLRQKKLLADDLATRLERLSSQNLPEEVRRSLMDVKAQLENLYTLPPPQGTGLTIDKPVKA